eukprot:m.65071 g.65071  ORF g.65071 m.65071 type:complete len:417 (+) comp11703_c0_seq1:176-1426(+)
MYFKMVSVLWNLFFCALFLGKVGGKPFLTLEDKLNMDVSNVREILQQWDCDNAQRPHDKMECKYLGLLYEGLIQDGHCSPEDAQKVKEAFHLRRTLWEFCMRYSRWNVSTSSWIDKAEVKTLVKSLSPDVKVAKTLAVVDDASLIQAPGFFDTFPSAFVMKGTHGSEMTVVVNNSKYVCINPSQNGHCLGETFSSIPEALYAHCQHWLLTSFAKNTGQSNYKLINPRCIFEESLVDENGKFPKDVKILTGAGQILAGRMMDVTAYSRQLQDTDSLPDFSGVYLKNTSMCRMEDVASNEYAAQNSKLKTKYERITKDLATHFLFARIDFFDTDPPIFQEVTFTPNNCGPNKQHNVFLGYMWGYMILMKKSISSQCMAHANYLALCNKRILIWLASQIKPFPMTFGNKTYQVNLRKRL